MYYSGCWECSNKQSRQDASFQGTLHLLVGREGQWSKCMLHKMISDKYWGETWKQREEEPVVNSVKNSCSRQLHNYRLSVRVWDLCEDNWNCTEIVAGELFLLCRWIKWDSVSLLAMGASQALEHFDSWQLWGLYAVVAFSAVFIPHPWPWLWDVVTNLTLAFPSWQEHSSTVLYLFLPFSVAVFGVVQIVLKRKEYINCK